MPVRAPLRLAIALCAAGVVVMGVCPAPWVDALLRVAATLHVTGVPRIALEPAGLSFEEAAALSDGTSIAIACLKKANLVRGKRIAVYGATGAIGTAGVQLAKAAIASGIALLQQVAGVPTALAAAAPVHAARA